MVLAVKACEKETLPIQIFGGELRYVALLSIHFKTSIVDLLCLASRWIVPPCDSVRLSNIVSSLRANYLSYIEDSFTSLGLTYVLVSLADP